MATRATVRTAVRRQLGDTAAPFVWSDDLLNDLLAEAVEEYGRIVPRVLESSSVGSSGVRSYAVAIAAEDEPLRVLGVEWPAGTPIPYEESVPTYTVGDGLGDEGYAQAWRFDGTANKIIVRNAPSDNITSYRVRWQARRVPATTDSAAVDVEEADLALVRLMVARAAWDVRATEDAKRGYRPGRNPYGFRVDQMLDRRRRRISNGHLGVS